MLFNERSSAQGSLENGASDGITAKTGDRTVREQGSNIEDSFFY